MLIVWIVALVALVALSAVVQWRLPQSWSLMATVLILAAAVFPLLRSIDRSHPNQEDPAES